MAPPTPTSPSYARSTRASGLKETGRESRSPNANSPSSTNTPNTKKIGKTATTPPAANSSSGNKPHRAQQHVPLIKPADPSRPCPIAALPMELRQEIFSELLPRFQTHGKATMRSPPLRQYRLRSPSLLGVCVRIRNEAAYLYYTRTLVEFRVRLLDFSRVKSWMQCIAPEHQGYLGLNRNLHIAMESMKWCRSDRYKEEDPWDGDERKAWRFCRRFVKWFSLDSKSHRGHCRTFSLLSDWFLVCAKPRFANVRWIYRVRPYRWVGDPGEPGVGIFMLDHHFGVWNLPCVRAAAIIDQKQRTAIKPRCLSMLRDLDEEFEYSDRWVEEWPEWEKRMAGLVKFLEMW